MDMVLRTFVAMGKILHILLKMFLYMAIDTIGDTERMGGFINQILDVASSEVAINPLFTALFVVFMLGFGWFAISQIKSSLKTVVIMFIVAGIIFLLEPVSAAILDAAALHEYMASPQILGASLILLSLILAVTMEAGPKNIRLREIS